MNTPETAAPADWHECRVTLPAPHNWLVLDLTAERPEEWARAAADEHFSADDTPADWREAFAEDVLWYWAVAARQKALCAAVLAPQDGGVAAFYCVRELGRPCRVAAPGRAARAGRGRRGAVLPSAGDHGGGAAAGRRAARAPPGAHGPRGRQRQCAGRCGALRAAAGVSHRVGVPPSLGALGLGEELGKMADELADSVRLV